MTTNLANPHYMPETAVKVTLINFMITEEGLREQILGKTVLLEKPELERMKNKLIVDSASNTKKLKELENKILHVLSSSSGSILDDETAVNVLTSSKKLSNEIQQKQIAAKETEIEIDNARQVYVPVSRCATAMFMTITQLEKVDPMYQYSLEWYMVLFETSVLNSRTQQQKVNMTVLLGAQQESTEICSRLVVLVLLFSCCCFRVVALVLLHSFLVLFSCTLFLYSHSFCIILALFYSCTLLLVHSFTRALFYSCTLLLVHSLSCTLSLSLALSLFQTDNNPTKDSNVDTNNLESSPLVNDISRCVPEAERAIHRILLLNNWFANNVYTNVCRSLFEKHKLLFSLMLTIQLMNCATPHQANDVNMYLRFLMTGGTASVPVNQCKAWLSDTSWAEICRLSTLSATLSEKGAVGNNGNNGNNNNGHESLVVGSDKLKFLKMKVIQSPHAWKEYSTSVDPSVLPIPGDWGDVPLTILQEMCILRCFRKDAILPATKRLVGSKMSHFFLQPPPFNLGAAFQDASSSIPLVSVGVCVGMRVGIRVGIRVGVCVGVCVGVRVCVSACASTTATRKEREHQRVSRGHDVSL
jgi:hypothetical protein